MKLTVFILALPMVIFVWLLLATHISDGFRLTLLLLWLVSSVICLAWGFYISRRSRLLGWLCVGVALIPLVMLMWPVVSHGGVKIHTEIFEHETNVV
jgi:hypothetical protein